jgi:hypothetical protein
MLSADTARLSVSYTTRTEAHCLRMDATAKGVCASYGARYLGKTCNPQAGANTLEWEMSLRQADRAEQDLHDFGGFATAVTVIA